MTPMLLPSSITGTPTSTSVNFVAVGARQEHPTTKIVVVTIAILVSLAMALWGAFGALAYRRYRSNSNISHTSTSLPTANRSQEWRSGAEKPELWEVSLKSINWEDYHDSLRVSHSVHENLFKLTLLDQPLAMQTHQGESIMSVSRSRKPVPRANNSTPSMRLWR